MRNLILLPIALFLWSCNNSNKTDNQPSEGSRKTTRDESISMDYKSLFTTCVACHGINGEGNKELGAPSIAGLDNWYIESQLANFRLGIRGDENDPQSAQMMAAAKTLALESLASLAQYITQMPIQKSKQSIEGNLKNGESVYNMICGACHGPGAKGNRALNAPALKGLNDWYLMDQFLKFKNGKRGTHPEDTFGAQMAAMSGTLPSEDALNDVIAYIASLQ